MNHSSVSPLTDSPQSTSEKTPQNVPAATFYQAPAIESVFTPDDMAREMFYAGSPVSDPGGGPGGGP